MAFPTSWQVNAFFRSGLKIVQEKKLDLKQLAAFPRLLNLEKKPPKKIKTGAIYISNEKEKE